MAEHIQEIIAKGDYSLRKKLLKKYPVTLLEILDLQSLGPKKVAFLWSNFKAATVADVEKLAREGKLRDVPGFGEKSEQNILKAVETHKRSTGRFRLDVAEDAAAAIIAHIENYPKAVASVTPAGSLRRGKETVGDLDLLLTLADGHTSQKSIDALAEHILKYPLIDQSSSPRGKQGQLHARQRTTGGRPAAGEEQFRRRAPLFHGIPRTQRHAAWARQRYGLHPQRIRSGHAQS